MKIITVLAISVLCAACSFAQDAKVIQLYAGDAAQAQIKWKALQDAQKDWDALQKRITKDYATVPEGDKDASDHVSGDFPSGTTFCGSVNGSIVPCQSEKERKQEPLRMFRKGWEEGIKFDAGFQFIVPKPAPVVTVSTSSWPQYCGGTFTPAATTTPLYRIGDPVLNMH